MPNVLIYLIFKKLKKANVSITRIRKFLLKDEKDESQIAYEKIDRIF